MRHLLVTLLVLLFVPHVAGAQQDTPAQMLERLKQNFDQHEVVFWGRIKAEEPLNSVGKGKGESSEWSLFTFEGNACFKGDICKDYLLWHEPLVIGPSHLRIDPGALLVYAKYEVPHPIFLELLPKPVTGGGILVLESYDFMDRFFQDLLFRLFEPPPTKK